MSFLNNLPYIARHLFDDGLDEVLIFAVIFILILLSGRDFDSNCEYDDATGFLPLIIIAVFLLLFTGFGRSEEAAT